MLMAVARIYLISSALKNIFTEGGRDKKKRLKNDSFLLVLWQPRGQGG